jgi:hypothetical protein
MESTQNRAGPPRGLRWTARIFGTLIAAFWTIMFVGESISTLLGNEDHGGEQTSDPTTLEIISFVGLGIATVGLVVGWWREGRGALLAFLGVITAIIAVPRGIPVFMPFLIAGFLYLATWLADEADKGQRGETSSTGRTPETG